jgi:hypothetical protein
MQNGWWVHDNLVVVNNRRWGVHYEHSPKGLPDDQTVASPKAPRECILVAGNGADARGGVSLNDAQNGTVRANTFGPVTVAGALATPTSIGALTSLLAGTGEGVHPRGHGVSIADAGAAGAMTL